MDVHIVVLLLLITKNVIGITEALDPMSQDYRYTNGAPISLQGFKLNGFNYKVFNSVTMIGCGQRCLAEFPKCVSYNYNTEEEFCELNSKGVSSAAEGITGKLDKEPKSVFVQTQAVSMAFPKTCAEHYKSGVRESGLYYIQDRDNQYYQVFCDFHSEANKVWTLVDSASYKNRGLPQFRTVALFINDPVNKDNPNWESYRLSLARMQDISRRSTHWRITCNFPQDGVNYRDYVRGKISDVDMLTLNGAELCKKVEYINVMGHKCNDCTAAWWQINGHYVFHHDSTFVKCDLKATPNSVSSQDNFGFYASARNTKFRCCSSDQSNNNIWFGSVV